MPTTPPTRSYVLWFSQRVGSTLLGQALEDTGIAGRPREWFHASDPAGVLAKLGAATPEEFRDALWREATTPNGVLGVKYGVGFVEPSHALITPAFTRITAGPDLDGRRTWEAFFPGCKHVFMTRRNKIRLAVSWWRAIKSQEWHRPARTGTVVGDALADPPDPALVDQYHYGAIEHLFVEANLREVAIQEQFSRWGIVPHTVVYEDFIAAFEPTVRGVLDYLDIPGRDAAAIAPPSFHRLADDISERWFERFRREREAVLLGT